MEFEYDTLKSIYRGALHEVLECHFTLDKFTVPELPFCQIHDEDSLVSLIVKWNQSVVSNALSAAQSHLDGRLPHKVIYMSKGGQAQYPGNHSGLRPDWAGVKPSIAAINTSSTKAQNVLPGETKLSRKWSSTKIEPERVEGIMEKQEWFLPLSQIFSYCVRANARYGYIITDKELVVIRVRPTGQSDALNSQAPLDTIGTIIEDEDDHAIKKVHSIKAEGETPMAQAMATGVLEYRAIPWQDHADRSMTVNLALWWLHMMAADSSAIHDRYPSLRDAVWSAEAGIRSSSLSISKSSDWRHPFAEGASNRRLQALKSDSTHVGKKRSRTDDGDDGIHVDEKRQRRKMRGSG